MNKGWLMGAKWTVAGLALLPFLALAADLVVYKSPYCGCCADWIKHMEANGFSVEVHNREDMDKVKKEMGVPSPLASCHTGEIGGYLVEGHVPAEDIRRLLKEKPEVKGIAVPGMPVGSPGMEVPGQKPDSYKVVTFTGDGKVQTFSKH